MTPAPRRWIRLDVGWSESDWLAELSAGARLSWVLLLGTVKRDGVGGALKAPSLRQAARSWRVAETEVNEMIEAAVAHGALARSPDTWLVAGWDDYQKPDHTAADRKRKQRGVTPGHAVTERDPSRDIDVDIDVDTDREDQSQLPPKVEVEYTINGVATDAHRVLGMGLWGNEFSREFGQTKSAINRLWVASGVPLSAVHEAVHGLRIMVDRGDVDWLVDKKQRPLDGIHVLTKQALLPGPDGKQLRSLFDAARDAYHSHDQQDRRGATSGPKRLSINPDGFAA